MGNVQGKKLEFTHFLRAGRREVGGGGKKCGNRPPFFGRIPTCKSKSLTGVHTHPKAVRPDGARRVALRRRASATDALAKAQPCTRQLQSFTLPTAQPLHSPPPQPLRYRECNLCAPPLCILCASASATFAFQRVHICAHAAPYGHTGRGLGGSSFCDSTALDCQ